jgi:hypothetical protein
MSNIHDLDDDDEAMKIDIRENIFWEVEETLKILMREWIGFFFVLWNENWHWWVVMCS